MKRLILFLIICSFIFIFQIQAFACWGFRPMGMGGAFVAVADDANLAYWNRAGAGQLDQWQDGEKQLVLTSAVWNRRGYLDRTPRLGNTYYDSINFAQKLNQNLGWSLAASWSGGGAISFSPSIGFRLPWAENMSLGIGYYLYRTEGTSLVGYDYLEHTIDMDYLWRLSSEWSVGVRMESLWKTSATVTYPVFSGRADNLEANFATEVNFRPGIAWTPQGRLKGLIVNAGIYDMFQVGGGPYYSAGFEYTPQEGFLSSSSFRAGIYNYNATHDADFMTLGYGLQFNKDWELGYWGAFMVEPFFQRTYSNEAGFSVKF